MSFENESLQGCRTTRIYCRSRCPAGKRMKAQNRVYFNSIEEARSQGYRACKVCKPDNTSLASKLFFVSRYQSPLGIYAVISSNDGIVCVEPEEEVKNRVLKWQKAGVQLKEESNEHNDKAVIALKEYFSGKLFSFDLPLDLRGTPFQRRVWQLLLNIPYGETVSYGHLAHLLGQDKAARAVGGAVGSNPISIIVPCHRVIGTNGTLTGYGGGLSRKKALLDLEKNRPGNTG